MALLCLAPLVPSRAMALPASSAASFAVQDTTPGRRLQGRRRDEELQTRPGVAAARDTLEGSSRPFPRPDSIMQLLMQRNQYRPVFYQGDTLRFTPAEGSLRIYERAHLERAGDRLFADSVVYTSGTRLITAYGKSVLINSKGEEVTSETGPFFYDTDRGLGTVVDGNTQWDVWNVSGNFTLEGTDTLWVKHGIFTSCDLPEPHYHFAADQIKLIFNNIVVAWPVRLYFGDVPVFWFPFFAQDVRQGRHSGILTPRWGINDIIRQNSGYNRHISNIGYYWAISDYFDAQASFDWWANTWTRLDAFFRYRWRRKFINGRFGYSQFFLPDGGRETSFVWNHNQKFGERTDLRASVQFVSSVQFEREAEFNPDRLTQQIRSNISLNRRFDWGTLALGAERLQPLTEGERTVLDVPQASLTLSPILLTKPRTPLERRWYHGLTWTGSGAFNYQTLDEPVLPDRSVITSSASTGLTLGSFRLSGNGGYVQTIEDKPDTLIIQRDTMIVGPDTTTADTTIIGPTVKQGTLNWSSSLGYQQRLIGSTTLTPSLSVSGSLFRSNETDQSFVSSPTRLSANASLNTDVFGFFPGVGKVQRIRHKFSPAFRWTYSPDVMASEEIQNLRGFSAAEVREVHQISVGLNQTFEAKLRPKSRPEDEEDEADTPPQERKITLLALRTSPVTYDFVTGRVTTNSISNNATSGLLRGLTLQLQHDLFEETETGRRFSPFLRQLNVSFSLGDRTFAGLFGGPGSGLAADRGIRSSILDFEDLPEEQLEDEPVEEDRAEGAPSPRRPWSLSIDYSLIRERPGPGGESLVDDRQSVRWNLGFSPTQNWTITWRSQFNLETTEFVDHVLSLRRDLHRWSANFDFLQAANGNFTFEFRVNLNDMPDVKFDWRTETRR